MKGGLKLTRKSILSMMMALAIMLSLFSITTFAATTTGENGTKNYELPLTSTVPTLDGDLSDATWSGETLTIQLNLKDSVANGGYAKNPTTSGANGELKAGWSNAAGKEGLYFAWHVKDETQSWAADIQGTAFNAMDAVQVVIDPLYKRRASKTDCAMCLLSLLMPACLETECVRQNLVDGTNTGCGKVHMRAPAFRWVQQPIKQKIRSKKMV